LTATASVWSQPAVQQVEVIGSTPLPGGGQPLANLPAPVQTATAQDLRNAQALNVSEHLSRRFGSVHINEMQGNPLQADLSFRGFTASPLLGTPQGLSVYLDGVRINQPFGDVVSWDLIPRNALAQMSLMPGSNPLFGLNTLGGALVLQTKNGHDDPGGELSVQLGAGGRKVIEGVLGLDLGMGLDLLFSSQLFKEQGWRDFSASDQQQVFAKLGWRQSGSRLNLSLAHAESRLQGNGLQDARFLATRWAGVHSQPDITRNLATLLSLVGTHEASSALSLSGNVYARRLRSGTLNGDVNDGALDQNLYYKPSADNLATLTQAGYSAVPAVAEIAAGTAFPMWNCLLNAATDDEPNEKCTGLINRTATQQAAWGLALQTNIKATWAGLANQLTFGAGLDMAQVDFQQSTEFGFVRPDRAVSGVGVFADGTQSSENAFDARVDLHSRSRTGSVFGSNAITLTPGVVVTAAGRYNRTTLDMLDRLDPAGTTGTLNAHHRFSRLNPSLGAVAGLTPQMSVYGALSQGSRAPTASELGCADPADPCRLPNAMASDPPLRKVVTQTLEAGLRGQKGAMRWNLGVFRADNRDDILFVASTTAGTGYFRNFGQTRRQGIEAGLSQRQGHLAWGANATWLQATFQSAETLTGHANSANDAALAGRAGAPDEGVINVVPGNRLPGVPATLLKAFMQWQATASLQLSADVQALGGSLARGNENNLHQADGRIFLGPGRSAGYGLLNLSGSWQISKAWSLSAKLNNALDRRYTTAAVLGATPFSNAGQLDARQIGSYANADGSKTYAVRQATFLAPGAPRQAFLTLRCELD
jgi:outer membrane receptor protein involved in Fe transport